MLQPLCMPALIYFIFSFTHVIIDMYKEQYSKAMIEFWISAVFTLLLNVLCQQGLGIISWLIISIPFILMTTIAALLLFTFKLNPATGKHIQPTQPSQPQQAQPTQAQPTQPTQPSQPTQTKPKSHPSGYAYPVDVFYQVSSFRSSK